MSLAQTQLFMTTEVSNAEILKKLETHEANFEGFNERMKEQGKRLDLFIEMMKDVPQDLKAIDCRLRKVEGSIDGIKITWNNRLFGGTLAVSAATAGIVAFALINLMT